MPPEGAELSHPHNGGMYRYMAQPLLPLCQRGEGVACRPLAKYAKDAAAGGVLAAAICAAAVGIFLFGQREPLLACLDYFLERPGRFLLLAFAAAGAVIFIFTDWDGLLKKHRGRSGSL